MWILVLILLLIFAPGIIGMLLGLLISMVYILGIVGAFLVAGGMAYGLISWIIKTIKSNL